ncbi:proteasome accessory factor PafA2 family protein, partial [Micrococcus sp. GbtcB5]|uniref:proteasome accessory factor PafA2 family protein n=1 Tax=Micrococcus sp. GbtcB5 TaxID=2824750 RepID=UPI001C2FF221
GEVLDAVRTGDRSRIEDRIVWAIKLRLLEDYRARHDLGWVAPRLAQLDLAFHDIDPGRGLFRMLPRRGAVARLLPE